MRNTDQPGVPVGMKQAGLLFAPVGTPVAARKIGVGSGNRPQRLTSIRHGTCRATRRVKMVSRTPRSATGSRLTNCEDNSQRRPVGRSKIGMRGAPARAPAHASPLPPAHGKLVVVAIENVPARQSLLTNPAPEGLIGKPLGRATRRFGHLSRACHSGISTIGLQDRPAHGVFASVAADDLVGPQCMERQRVG